jgi:hypothetical protein
MMKKASATIVFLLLTTAAFGQENGTPDYSREAIQKLMLEVDVREPEEPPVRFHVGAIEFRALGTKFRFNYLPIMMPLPGTRLGVTQEWPDPFALTGTAIATPRRAWRTQRAVNAELRRIDRKVKASVVVKTR